MQVTITEEEIKRLRAGVMSLASDPPDPIAIGQFTGEVLGLCARAESVKDADRCARVGGG